MPSMTGYPVPPSSSLAPTPSFGASALMSGGGQPGWLAALQGVRGVTQQLSAGFADDPRVREQQSYAIQQQQTAAAEQKHQILGQIIDSAKSLAQVYRESGAGPNAPAFQAYAKQVEGQLTRLGLAPEDVGAFMQQLYAEVSAPLPVDPAAQAQAQALEGLQNFQWPGMQQQGGAAVAVAGQPTAGGYYSMVGGFEGGPEGYAAQNPNSTATGRYQFIDGTARNLGYDPAELAGDPNMQEEAMQRLTMMNATALKRGLGKDPVDHEVYLAHLVGDGGAIEMLRADPAESTHAVLLRAGYTPELAAKAVRDNARILGGSVGDALAFASQKFGNGQTWQQVPGQAQGGAAPQQAGGGRLNPQQLAQFAQLWVMGTGEQIPGELLKALGQQTEEPFTLSAGQTRYGPNGQPIASVAGEAKTITLNPGQVAFDANGRQIASVPAEASEPQTYTLSPGQTVFNEAGQPIASVPKTEEGFTLGAGQTRYGADGRPIAASPTAAEGFTLGEGQVRYGPDGKPIASVPAAKSDPVREQKIADLMKMGMDRAAAVKVADGYYTTTTPDSAGNVTIIDETTQQPITTINLQDSRMASLFGHTGDTSPTGTDSYDAAVKASGPEAVLSNWWSAIAGIKAGIQSEETTKAIQQTNLIRSIVESMVAEERGDSSINKQEGERALTLSPDAAGLFKGFFSDAEGEANKLYELTDFANRRIKILSKLVAKPGLSETTRDKMITRIVRYEELIEAIGPLPQRGTEADPIDDTVIQDGSEPL